MRKALRKQTVTINKELYWILQNWDNIMALVMCGTYMNREVHTAGDFTHPVEQEIGSYPQTPRSQGKRSGRAPETSTKTTFPTGSATEQGTSSQQHEGDKYSGNKNTREDRYNQQEQRTGGNDHDDSGSNSSSEIASSSALSVRSILQSRNNNQRRQRTKSVEQEHWE